MSGEVGTKPSHLKFRFGSFEVDTSARELRKNGVRLKLEPTPYKLLLIFIERPGEVIETKELKKLLWPDSEKVDDVNLRKMIEKVRVALPDHSPGRKFIETVPTVGYKFVAEVVIIRRERSSSAATPAQLPDTPSPDGELAEMPHPEGGSAPTRIGARANKIFLPGYKMALGALGLVFTLLAIAVVQSWPGVHFSQHDRLLIADFENQTGEAKFDGSLLTAFTVGLEQSRYTSVYPKSRLASALQRMGLSSESHITISRAIDLCRRESIRALIAPAITQTGDNYLVTARIIDPQTGAAVRSYSELADGSSQVLPALAKLASNVRAGLGESLSSIHQTERPLPEVTTPSIIALKNYAEGVSLWRHGKYRDAISQYQLAIDTDPDFAMAHAALGNANCSYILNNPIGCRSEYQKALSLTGRMTVREHMRIQADYAVGINHAAEAETLIHSYLRLYPDDQAMILSLGHFLRTHNRDTEAIEQYQRLLHITPGDASTYVDLATSYKGLADYPNAIRAYETAIGLEPQKILGDATLSREYGFTLVAHGDESKAEAIFTAQFANRHTREASLRSLALLDVLHGRCFKARSRFQDALRMDEAEPSELSALRVHLWLAYVSDLMGDHSDQRKHLDAVATKLGQIGPKVVIGAWLGDAYARARFVTQAQQVLGDLNAVVDSQNKAELSHYHFLKAVVDIARGRVANATDLLHLSLQEDEGGPAQSFDLAALALAAHQSRELDDEIAAYEQLLATPRDKVLWELLPVWLSAHYFLAEAYLAHSRPEKARAVLDELLTLWKSGDPNLPLLQKAISLRASIPIDQSRL